MASKTSRKEWVRGLPWAFGVGRYERKRLHWASERSVGYGFLIGESVRNHPNPHLYQTGSKVVRATRDNARRNGVGDRLEPQAMIRVCSVSGDPWRRLCWRDEQTPYSVWARRVIFWLRALEWFRGGASTGRDLHDLERLQARGADVGALRRGTFLDTDFLQVWVPAPAGCAQRVTARVAEVWTLSAGITDFSHDKSPVLRYRPMRGEGPEETVKRTPKSGLWAEIVPDPCGT